MQNYAVLQGVPPGHVAGGPSADVSRGQGRPAQRDRAG
jgi:hypothetical protein